MKRVTSYFKWILGGMVLPVVTYAQDGMAAAVAGAGPWVAPAVGFGIAVAVFAAASAQGKIAASFMEGTSRNPGAVDVMKTPLILSLIFVETLVLFTVLIAIMLLGKIPG